MDLDPQTVDDDGTELYGQDALAALNARIDEQSKLRRRLASEHPRLWARYAEAKERQWVNFEQDPRRSAKVAQAAAARERGEQASLDLSAEWTRAARAAVATVHDQGRASRPATNERSRGSRRGERASSSSSDDPDDDPEPHRTCWCGCGFSLNHLRVDARYLNNAHKNRAHRATRAEADLTRDRSPLPVAEVKRPCAECPHTATWPDVDGNPMCMHCGSTIGEPRLNGWDASLALFNENRGHSEKHRRNRARGRWNGLVTRLPSDPYVRPQPWRDPRQDQQSTTAPSSSSAARGQGGEPNEFTKYPTSGH